MLTNNNLLTHSKNWLQKQNRSETSSKKEDKQNIYCIQYSEHIFDNYDIVKPTFIFKRNSKCICINSKSEISNHDSVQYEQIDNQ